MKKPRLLDLFCGAGGAAMGYHRAGFEVVGVDINPQPRYPFEFHQADAIDYLINNGHRFDAFHASPPCQHATTLKALHKGKDYPNLIPRCRDLLEQTERLFVIENVVGSKLYLPILLCGSMFGLTAFCQTGMFHQLRRHRLFECSIVLDQPKCHHAGQPVGVYGNGGGGKMTRGYKGTKYERFQSMGIDWMNHKEVAQAIPPAYTEYVGLQLMNALV